MKTSDPEIAGDQLPGDEPITAVSVAFDTTIIPGRLRQVVDAVGMPGASALLIGESGTGKSRLAEAAAYELEVRSNGGLHVTVMAPPPNPASGFAAVFGIYFPEILENEAVDGAKEHRIQEPAVLAKRLLRAILDNAEGAEPVIVAPAVHDYHPLAAFLLEQLVRSRKVRVIATAQRLTGAAERMSRDPRVRRVSVGALSLEESDIYVSGILGVTRIAPETLRRWHTATGGNSYALSVLALACERRGLVRRSRGMAWVPPGLDDAPEEFAHFVAETCNERERSTLEMIAQAEPMIETPLLKLLDPVATNSLLERGLIVSRRHPNGDIALEAAHPILAAAVREHISSARRAEICAELFDALDADRLEATQLDTPQQLMRLVVFGLESGKSFPRAWLSQAFAFLRDGADPRLMLRIALELSLGAEPVEAAVAALRAVGFARLLGDVDALEQAFEAIDEILLSPERCGALPAPLHTRLRLLQIEHLFRLGAEIDAVLEMLTELELSIYLSEHVAREMVKTARYLLLSFDGRLRAADDLELGTGSSQDLTVEWVRAPARAISSLILQQQGRLDEAIQTAENARQLSMLGNKASVETIDLQGFCWFFGFWASGSNEAGRQTLDEVEETANADVHTFAYLSGLLETGEALFAIQEGRWRDAAEQAERILEQLRHYDSYGVAPLLHAVHALALAALGESDAATRAYRRALREQRGVSQAVTGFRKRLLLRTQQWLGIGDPLTEAMRVAEWARAEGMALVELEALHNVAIESRLAARSVLARAQELCERIDQPIGEVILAHIEKIVAGGGATDVEEPEVRLLAELGLWLPLPAIGGLSAREREIALFASLGYSARFIADRLHLSVRTVETHLGHVYSKVGVEDRDGLRRWFSNERDLQPRLNGFGGAPERLNRKNG